MKKAILLAVLVLFIFTIPAVAKEFSGDYNTTIAGNAIPGKIYFKNPQLHRTESMGIISLSKYPMVYQIFEESGKYIETDAREAAQKNPLADVRDMKDWIRKNNLKKIGKEKIEGFKCIVYEGKLTMGEDQPPVPMKIWYAKKLDYPIRYEAALPAPMGMMTFKIVNIKVGKQSKGLFEIPKGFTKAASAMEAMGMPNFKMPTRPPAGSQQAAKNKTPTQKQLGNMMKQMMQNLQNQ